VQTESVKARLRVTPPPARAAVQVAVRVGFVDSRGYAYPASYDGPWTFVGTIGNVGAVIRLIRWVGDAEDFVYAAHLGRCERTGGNPPGVCVLSVGIAFACCPADSLSH
jgi:hypothetical protein